jgi:mono/diheme cytochrome c family protein/glucose/arabinose dehydrogenase
MAIGAVAAVAIVYGVQHASRAQGEPWPPPVRQAPQGGAPLSPADEAKTMVLPPGYHVQLVASEPLVIDPIVMDFDADGRLWVLEMPGFAMDAQMRDSHDPICRAVVLEDTDNDGVMDKRTVFADGLVLPRAIKVLEHGVLIGEPPHLWLMRDTNGDLKADTKELVSDDYGRAEGNIEHNANSLYWAMDNWMYTSEHDWYLRLKHGKFEIKPTLSRGQWGVSQDDAGRIFRNVNDEPLFIDILPASYYMRNPNMARTRGLYELLIEREDAPVWPVRPTRGVNRGYREQFFRPDDSSTIVQGTGTPTIYRGDQLPAELEGNAFITDSTTNLVHRLVVVDDGTGRLTAKNAYAKGEILASTDERFRPVNLANAPDGTLYVADMYRGVVQDGAYQTDYLRDYIKTHDLQAVGSRGRIWRIVHDTTKKVARPALHEESTAGLVKYLSNPNGWWRDTAQRLMVEREDTSIAPALKQLAATAPDWRTKLHALWTLDGIDAIDQASVEQALHDASPFVRASAIRLSERWLGEANSPLAGQILALMDDPNWQVRRQLAASIGALPEAARIDPAVQILTKYGSDPITVDATISGLAGLEEQVLDRVTEAQAMATESDAATMLVAAVAKGGNVDAIARLLTMATASGTPAWKQAAILKGLDTGLPAPGGGRGRGGFGARAGGGGRGGRGGAARGVNLPAEPAGLTKLAAGTGDAAEAAKAVVAKLDWPGKPQPVNTVPPLTPEQQKLYAAGAEVYKNICIGCHQANGQGLPNVAANLVTSQFVTSPDPGMAERILLAGKEGSIGLMPPLAGTLSDEQIAAVLTYIRREWGHTASPVNPADVTETRGLTSIRKTPWTDQELLAGRRGGGAGRAGRAGGPAGGGRGRGAGAGGRGQ